MILLNANVLRVKIAETVDVVPHIEYPNFCFGIIIRLVNRNVVGSQNSVRKEKRVVSQTVDFAAEDS